MSLSRPRQRARLSMTSLIDVIFLLLLFFMLSSTFSKFSEIELRVGGTGAAPEKTPEQLFFLRLTGDRLTLNGQPATAETLPTRLTSDRKGDAALIVSVTETATAQGLADVLSALRGLPDLSLSVIGPG